MQNCFVKLERFFDRNFNIEKLILSLNELVQGLELTDVFFSEPLSDFSELGSDGALLVSVEFFDHDVVFILEEFFNFVDGCVVDGFNSVAVEFSITK